MEEKLKGRFDVAVEAAIERWLKDNAANQGKGEGDGTKTSLLLGQKRPMDRVKNAPLKGQKRPIERVKNVPLEQISRQVRRRLKKERLWTKIGAALIVEAVAETFRKRLAKIERASVDESQLALPGFEHLPKRIGTAPIATATVSKFLDYEERYSKKADRDQLVSAELKKAAERVLRFKITEPDLAMSEALRRADEPRGLALVHSAGHA